MKICTLNCSIALVLLIADIYVTYSAQHSGTKLNFFKLLSAKQRKRYELIVTERRNIYYQSYLLGIVISFIFLALTSGFKRDTLTSAGIICSVGAITLVTNYFYYILSPKTDFMVLHLDSRLQRQAWVGVYRQMQINYHLGLLFGVMASMFLAKSICKS